jgi:hypothetical protein
MVWTSLTKVLFIKMAVIDNIFFNLKKLTLHVHKYCYLINIQLVLYQSFLG